ncbi:hypothetical protein EJ05DRAFT_92735 [Pseudovirgaria hyperparasitica]|uniref:Uncharacterized protein n=1 Tax=Pseudovirgaria hyperparasitica TaxID=470096 RepID=A0A6A6VZV8_9PEZI|nr:uncharacterized protein EJ05DRAFT_92735 [Pseudovirgaria hyperparasitica]KAF2756182.1 hypothetical protein EJ05DRAFT_92735 [Pseudovirgaria hyperparasitica]
MMSVCSISHAMLSTAMTVGCYGRNLSLRFVPSSKLTINYLSILRSLCYYCLPTYLPALCSTSVEGGLTVTYFGAAARRLAIRTKQHSIHTATMEGTFCHDAERIASLFRAMAGDTNGDCMAWSGLSETALYLGTLSFPRPPLLVSLPVVEDPSPCHAAQV